MGISESSLLDQSKTAFIRGEAQVELRRFAPFYRRQFSVARFCEAQSNVEQLKEQNAQLLRQRVPPEGGEVLYEDAVFYFDETRKWRERYIVMRANYSLECHESLESFLKGAPPHHRLLPTGGAVLTTEERYMELVDRCFPDDASVQEDFAPPLSSMPGQFPVYLRLPYRRDSYFCFRQQQRQEHFLYALRSCVRHQNQDFLKKSSCEVQSFLKAMKFYRESQGRYEAWSMMMGSDVRVLSNAVMERLLPTLEKDLLPKLKSKKNDKKRLWFCTVEAVYVLVQETLLEGLSCLKDELRSTLRQREVQIHSDMDLIQRSREQLQEQVQAVVWGPAEGLCVQKVQPYLSSVLEELMGPISQGFAQGREACAGTMERVREGVLQGEDRDTLQEVLRSLSGPVLGDSFQAVASLDERLQRLRERFGFKNVTGLVHSAQIDLQQLVENAAFTFETLLSKVLEEHQDNAASAIDKARHRVLKHFDYDSSSMRKKICEEVLVQITLPYLKEHLQEQHKQVQNLQFDHSDFIDIENVYEDVLLSVLHKEVSKVVKEAATLQKFNLCSDSRDLLSRCSASSAGSAPASPAPSLASSPCAPNHSPSPMTTPHTPTRTQEVQGDADPAGAQTVETNGDKMAAVENTNRESAANGRQDAKVVVEEIRDILEETGNEIRVNLQDKEGNKMVESAERKSEDQERVLVSELLSNARLAGNHKMFNPEENLQQPAEITAGEEDGEQTSKLHDDVFDQKEETAGSETAGSETAGSETAGTETAGSETAGTEIVEGQKQEVVSATKEETNLEPQSPRGNEASENQGEEKTTAKNEEENKMADATDVKTDDYEAPESETGNVEGQGGQGQGGQGQGGQGQEGQGQEGQVQGGQGQEGQGQGGQGQGGQGQGQEGQGGQGQEGQGQEGQGQEGQGQEGQGQGQGGQEGQGQEVQAVAPSGGQAGEDEEDEEDCDDEGSTTSDVLEDNSQSPLSSEENDQSEERSRTVPEISEELLQTPPEHPLEEGERPPEAGEHPPEEGERPLEEGEGERPLKEEKHPLEEGERPLEEGERPLDCIRAIRELVQEVIEVEDLVQRYPSGVPVESSPEPGLNQD